MPRRAGQFWLSLLAVMSGCVQPSETALIPASPFAGNSSTASRFPQITPTAAATTEAAVNVARIGQKVVSANPGTNLQVQFSTIGGDSAPLELFHRGESSVFITETLARQCKTEGELAALLSVELGKIVAERAATRVAAVDEHGPPPEVNIGNDVGGRFGPPDGTRMIELAKYERKRALAREQLAPPAPEVLARAYLQAAGYNPADVDAVASLLKAADGNTRLEKLIAAPAAK